ncbi:MAG: amidohydrolase [Propionibacteriaceae bacterium]|jgi:predicted amidohydrolase YtcJ|nr:amidohydrolase [Propionibacteriaceae bacterium]
MLLRHVHLLGRPGPAAVLIGVTGVVEWVGPDADRPAAGTGPEVDGDGRWLLPGFWDEHVHFRLWAELSRRLDLGAAPSAAAAAALVADRARRDPSSPLIAVGFRDALWPDAPAKGLLDAAAPDSAVYAFSGDLHSMWLNSPALARHGLAGHPTGLLRETDCFRVMEALAGPTADPTAGPDSATEDRWILEAAAQAATRGVTGIVDLDLTWGFDAWAERAARGVPVRVAVGVYPENLGRAVQRGYRTGQPLNPADPAGLVTVGPLKVITDGSLNTRTAWCFDPYPGLSGPDACGVASVPPPELAALITAGWAAGLVPAVHAIGDRANAAALDAFEQVGCPGRIEHAQLLRPEDIRRLARLGITASVQPEHAVDDRDVADRYWAGRTARAFPFRDLLDAGVTLALGSDAPVAPLDPWIAVGAAVTRTRGQRRPWHPEQAMTTGEALKASARGRATVEPGMTADLQLVERNPLAIDPADLRTMPVALTLLAGRVTHTAL